MKLAAAIERLERVASTRAHADALPDDLTSALRASSELASFLASAEADLARRLAASTSFPEAVIAETTRSSLNDAEKAICRSKTLDQVPQLAEALDNAAITPGHIDAVTRGAKPLEPEQRQQLFDAVESLVDVAAHATIEEFGRRIRAEVNRIIADDGVSRLERQRRATTLSTWVDQEGMWNLRGKFDPVTGLRLAGRLDHAIETLFAEATPATCPSDPIEKQRHLRALALDRLLSGEGGSSGRGRPEFVAVINVDVPAGHENGCAAASAGATGTGGLAVDWPIPIEVPAHIMREMLGAADLSVVVVCNGVVLHAPGNLNLGRSTRLANRDQRRALRGLYSGCAMPGCRVGYDNCKLHHILWWRNGGATDLDNLIPVCSKHHHKIHDDGWVIDLDEQRRLTLTLPDGSVRSTGPPSRGIG